MWCGFLFEVLDDDVQEMWTIDPTLSYGHFLGYGVGIGTMECYKSLSLVTEW